MIKILSQRERLSGHTKNRTERIGSVPKATATEKRVSVRQVITGKDLISVHQAFIIKDHVSDHLPTTTKNPTSAHHRAATEGPGSVPLMTINERVISNLKSGKNLILNSLSLILLILNPLLKTIQALHKTQDHQRT